MTDFQKVYWLVPASGFYGAGNISNGDNQACLPYSGSMESVSNVRIINVGAPLTEVLAGSGKTRLV
jgi:hypothetical protein